MLAFIASSSEARDVVGTELHHTVQPGDTLRSLAARYAVEPARQAEALGVTSQVDWTEVRAALREHAEIAVAIDGSGGDLAAVGEP